MSPTLTIVLIIVVLLVIAAIVYGVQAGRRKKLQNTFGPEYDRVVADTGSRTEAEKELRERTKRHAELELKPLSPESRARYAAAWEEVQIQFVDTPSEAASTADELVTRLIAERGYPTGDYDERVANLSVEHANTLQQYREAHEISQRNRRGEASTEDLRQALVHYRALFAELLGADPLSDARTAGAGDLRTADTDGDDLRADEHRVGEHRVGEHRAGEHRVGDHRAGDLRTGDTGTGDLRTDARTGDPRTADAREGNNPPAPAPRTAADDDTKTTDDTETTPDIRR